ncbi:MAG: hypothetical protein K2Q10_09455 [Rhodospirillales bacterium]|nr:hypothetical protein [Rhodospirillales bacterium]
MGEGIATRADGGYRPGRRPGTGPAGNPKEVSMARTIVLLLLQLRLKRIVIRLTVERQ